jgi:uncharacterized protein (TIGR00369 family)
VTDRGVVMQADELHAFMVAAFDRPLSWTIERVDDDGVRVRQPVGGGDLRPGGTVSGPTLMALSDGVAYIAVLSRIGPEALAVTTNLNINFLRRPRPVDLVADARILKLGRTLALVDVLVYSDGGDPEDLERPVAQSVVTYSMALLTPPTDTGATAP